MGSKVKAQKVYDLRKSTSSITRTADTADYAANDVMVSVATAGLDYFTFNNVVDSSCRGRGELLSVKITSSSYVATGPDLTLWLFDAAIAEVVDNLAFALTDAEMAYVVGTVVIPTANWRPGTKTVGAGGNQLQFVTEINLPFKALNSEDGALLYGILIHEAAYTPVSGETYTVTLYTRSD